MNPTVSSYYTIQQIHRGSRSYWLADPEVWWYRAGRRAKKWYFSLLTNCIDIAVVNAWIIYIVSKIPVALLEFKRSLTRWHLQISSASMQKIPGHPKNIYTRVLPDIRYISIVHRCERTEAGKQRKCALWRKKAASSASSVMSAIT